jgi:Ca2+-binding EF-hand superfamily protein
MNRFLIGGAAAALVIAMAPVIAQPAPPPPPGVSQGTAPPPVVARPQMKNRMMVMSNKTMTRDEVVRHVHDMFARLDTNRDGYLTREEVDAIGNKMMGMHADMERHFGEGAMPKMDRGAMFDRLDANHDGSISRREYMAAKPDIHERRMMIMHGGPDGADGERGMHMHGMGMGHFGGHLFDMADANRDGRVSLAEAQAAMLAHFDKADFNHDGRITPEERQQAHQLRRGQQPAS